MEDKIAIKTMLELIKLSMRSLAISHSKMIECYENDSDDFKKYLTNFRNNLNSLLNYEAELTMFYEEGDFWNE